MAPCCERRHRPRGTIAVCLSANVLNAMNSGVLIIVIPVLTREFGCSTEVAAWVNLAPRFVSVIIGTQMGKVADTMGRARMYMVCTVALVASFAMCGFAPSIEVLLAGRVLAGLVWGGAGPAGFGMMCEGLPREQRGVVAAWQMMSGTMGSSLGTAAGGIIIEYVGWRYLFRGPLPPLALLLAAAHLVLPRDSQRKEPQEAAGGGPTAAPFDCAGSVAFAVFMTCFLLGVNRGNDLGWRSPAVLGMFAAAAVALPVLVVVERRAASPILPCDVLRDRTSLVCIVLTNLVWTPYMGAYLVLPIYLSVVRGLGAAEVGFLCLWRPLTGFAVSVCLARLLRRPAPPCRLMMRLGCLITLLATLGLVRVVDLPLGQLQPGCAPRPPRALTLEQSRCKK
jgi:MFS family permease